MTNSLPDNEGPVEPHERGSFLGRLRQSRLFKIVGTILGLIAAAAALLSVPKFIKHLRGVTDQSELYILPGTDADKRFFGDGVIAWDAENAPGNKRLLNGGVRSAVALTYEDGKYQTRAIVVRSEGADDLALTDAPTVSIEDYEPRIGAWYPIDPKTGATAPPQYFQAWGGNSYGVSRPISSRTFTDDGEKYVATFYKSDQLTGTPGNRIEGSLSWYDTTGFLHMSTDQDVFVQKNGTPKVQGEPTFGR